MPCELYLPPNYGDLRQVEMSDATKCQRLMQGAYSKISCTKADGSLVAENWIYCREYFQNKSKGIRRMLFCHRKNKSHHIAAFMHKIELMVNTNPKSSFGPTQRNNITWIKVSPWWTTSSMRRSFFTALLRCAQNYSMDKNNFEEALFSIAYTRNTRCAVHRFLGGNTKYNGRIRGWYHQFRDSRPKYSSLPVTTNSEIRKLLIKP